MKTTIKVEKEVDVKTLEVIAKVRYWEDTDVNGTTDEDGTEIPCRKGENWCPVIDVEKGQVLNWNIGYTADVHYKVCDCGLYRLKDDAGNIIGEKDGYVPNCMSPAESGYGDYIIMHIDQNGIIEGWEFDVNDVEHFISE